jgi:hypothetical protein
MLILLRTETRCYKANHTADITPRGVRSYISLGVYFILNQCRVH